MRAENCLTCGHSKIDYEYGLLRCDKEEHVIGFVNEFDKCDSWIHSPEGTSS